MFGINKRKFKAAHRLLREVAARPTNARLLLALQRKLIEQIVHLETRIAKAKRARREANAVLKRGGRSREESGRLRTRIREADSRIDALNHLLFVWRCFGDGIAFIHLDKFGLKQTYFETGSVRPKQSAGWISGKAGLAAELEELQTASRSGLPVLLTDLTNTICHGDLCVLIGPDPLLLETKSSERLNSRGKRQRAALDKLSSFYATDVAKELRGYQEVRRVQVHAEEVAYVDELNACIESAAQFDIGMVRPEPGLHYVAVYGGSLEDMGASISAITRDTTQAFYLNEFKSDAVWPPYSPFVLSIRNVEHLFDFIRGRLGLVILFDHDEFDRRLNERGIARVAEAHRPDDGGEGYVTIENTKTGAKAAFSGQLMLRIILEFTSPDWMADYFQQLLQRTETSPAEEVRGAT